MCADPHPGSRLRQRPTRGVSLVELMIGLVVGLLVSLAAVSSLRIFGASQSQGTVTGGGLLSAVSAMGAIKNDVAAAGLGFFDGRLALCSAMNLSLGTGAIVNGTVFSPLLVTREPANDRLDLVYGSNVSAGSSVPLATPSDGSSIDTLSTLPAAVGQAVMLAPASTGLCTVRSVTAVTAGTVDTPQVLAFANTGAHNKFAFTTAPAYAAQARATLLGALQWHRYRVIDNNLVLEQPLDGSSAVLVRNVVGFRVEYGISDTGGSTLQSWQNAGDAGWGTLSPASISRVRAVRLGLVVRSPQREKPDASGNCIASSAKPRLFGAVIEPDVDDWGCYRFRSSTIVVPLRNLVWGQTR